MASTLDSTTSKVRPVGTRTQALGLALAAFGIGMILLLGVMSGLAEEIEDLVFFLIVGAVALVGSVLSTRGRRWSAVVGILLSLLVGFFVFWTAFGLLSPMSFGDFVPGVAVPLGIVLGIVGGVKVLRSHKRDRLSDGPSSGEQRLQMVAIGLVAVAIVGSGAWNLLARSTATSEEVAGATLVGLKGFEFDPMTIEVAAGEDARIVAHNHDAFLHDFSVPALDIEETIVPSSDAVIDLAGVAPGTYVVYCTLHSDTDEPDPDEAGMAATLIVT